MPGDAERFSFAIPLGDGSFLLRDAEEPPLGCRFAAIGFVLVMLCELLEEGVLLDWHQWKPIGLLVVPFVTIFCIALALAMRDIKVDVSHGSFSLWEGVCPFLRREVGELKQLRFVCVETFERWESRRGASKNAVSYKQRVVGARAYIGLPIRVEGRDERIVFTQFSRDVQRNGSFEDVFPWEHYSRLIDEASSFACMLKIPFKQIGHSALESTSDTPKSDPEQRRCPKCGFSYGWNGSSCGHCHHRRTD
jgi:hypothetical protein